MLQQNYCLVSNNCLTESKLWILCLGSPGENQLELLPGNVTGIPPGFHYHPFWFLDWKEEAGIKKQAASKSAERTTDINWQFCVNFSFMQALSLDYQQPDKAMDRVVASWDGYSSYLLAVDEASHYTWVFLTKTKEPPLDIVDTFLDHCGHEHGGLIHTDQGGELANLFAFTDMLLRKHKYIIEPTYADSPSQNGVVNINNAKLAVCTCTLLFGSGLPAKYSLLALINSV
jgi:hypothetical protein